MQNFLRFFYIFMYIVSLCTPNFCLKSAKYLLIRRLLLELVLQTQTHIKGFRLHIVII